MNPQGYDVNFGQSGPQVTPHTLGRRPGIQGPPPSPMGRRGLGGSMMGNMNTPRPYSPMQQMTPGAGMQGPMGVNGAIQRQQNNSGGVRPGMNMMGGPSVPGPGQGQGPSLEQIQSEMARRQVGSQLGPRNGALAGYMMG